jgi:hypothetical protein
MKLKSFLQSVAAKLKRSGGQAVDTALDAVATVLPVEGSDAHQAKIGRNERDRTFLLAARAARRRSIRHGYLQGIRRNTRGLPVGMSEHEAKRARALEVRARHDHLPEHVSVKQIEDAEQTIAQIERNTALRATRPRPSKLARRLQGKHKGSCSANRSMAAIYERRGVAV